MPYHQTQQLDTRQSIIIDAHDAAHFIESMLQQVLNPPTPGLYLPDQLEPVLKVGGSYWYEKTVFIETAIDVSQAMNRDASLQGPVIYNNEQPLVNLRTTPWQYYRYEYIPVTNMQEVQLTPWDILDSNPDIDPRPKRVLLTHHDAKLVSPAPTLPVIGLKIVQQLLNNEIVRSRAFGAKSPSSIEDIVTPFLQAQYQGVVVEHNHYGQPVLTTPHIRNDRWFQETLSMVFDAVLPLAISVREQLRNNPYQMCTINHRHGFQFSIEQLGDYRIMEWEKLQNDPEFHRWQNARNTGHWDQFATKQEENIATNSAYIATSNPYI